MTDVTTLIEQDHRAVERLFARYKEDRAMATVRRICDALDAHANAEEAVFYRAVRDEVPDGARIAHRATSDHGRVRDLVSRINSTKDGIRIQDLLDALEQRTAMHAREEESAILPKARDALSEARRNELGTEYQAAKQL